MIREKIKEEAVWSYDLTGPLLADRAPIRATRGVVFVEICNPPDMRNGIALPSTVAAGFRNHVGVVVASGYAGIECGDNVIVRLELGNWRDCLESNGYKSQGEVISFGTYVDDKDVLAGYPFVPERVDASLGVVGKIVFVDGTPELRPLGMNTLIQRKTSFTEDRGLILPDSAHWRDNTGHVVGIGNEARKADPDLHIGDEVLYNPWAVVSAKGIGEDLCFVHYDGIEAIL